jgi:hypothetical protein
MSIPSSLTPLFNSGSSAAAGVPVEIERSLRFNSADSAFLSRTPAVSGDRRTWTWAAWVKRSKLGISATLFASRPTSSPLAIFYFSDQDYLRFDTNSNTFGTFQTNAVFRDCSAWYHVVLAADSSQSTDTNRLKLYVNGVQQTFSSASYPSQNTDGQINTATLHGIGAVNPSTYTDYFSGYLADIHFIDGQALTPSSFTEVSATTGQLVPIAYTGGSYGTNGFYLQFADNSAATAATLGADTSGNGNNWTPNNFSTSTGGPTPVSYGRTANSGSDAPSPAQGTPTYASGSDIILNPSDTSGDGDFQNTRVLGFQNITGVTTLRVLRVAGTSDAKLGFNGTLSTVGAFGSFSFPATIGQAAWYTVTSPPSTLTSMAIAGGGSGGSNQHQVYRIEVNGVELYDVYAAADNDSLVDTPTSISATDTGVGNEVRGNYCTLNPLHSQGATFSNGNLQFATASIGKIFGTIAVSSGKWYWEAQNLSSNSLSSLVNGVGLISGNPNTYGGGDVGDYAWLTRSNTGSPSSAYNNGNILSGYGNVGVPQNAIVGTAFNADIGTLEFFVNGVSQGVAWNNIPVGGDKLYAPISGDPNSSTNTEGSINFGQRAFSYTAPSGYKCLVDTNIPVVVAKPNTAFDTVLWTGNDTGQTITMPGAFSPDLVWTKMQSAVNNHWLFDVIRGADQGLSSSSTTNELTRSSSVTAFGSTGFTLGTNADVNSSAYTYVAWAWDAGSSTVSNTAGSITSQVRANPTAGFSVATFTGATTGTVGHGLGVAPSMIIMKARTSNPGANDWFVYHKTLGNTKYLMLNSTAAEGTYTVWNNTSPTSTVFSIGSGIGTPDWVAYCFAPVDGYSSFGSYTGNGSADGPFVYTGFRPRWIMIKSTGSAENWFLLDTARNTYNAVNSYLMPNSSSAEDANNSTVNTDFLSNGFKLRATTSALNTNAITYIYYAVAENPFQYSRAR